MVTLQLLLLSLTSLLVLALFNMAIYHSGYWESLVRVIHRDADVGRVYLVVSYSMGLISALIVDYRRYSKVKE